MRDRGVSTETEPAPGVEGPLRRWARRRREVAREEEAAAEAHRQDRKDESAKAPDAREPDGEAPEAVAVEEKVLTDADMPPLESLHEDSDYSGFLSPGVSEGLRRRALRKLFMSAVFNVRDGLDDYDDDFTSFEPLGDVVTSDMKHQAEMEAERARRARADAAQAPVREDEAGKGRAGETGREQDAPTGDEAVSATDGEVTNTTGSESRGTAGDETTDVASSEPAGAANDEAVELDTLPEPHDLSAPPELLALTRRTISPDSATNDRPPSAADTPASAHETDSRRS